MVIGVGDRFLSVTFQAMVTISCVPSFARNKVRETSREESCGGIVSTSTHTWGSSPVLGRGPATPPPLTVTRVIQWLPWPATATVEGACGDTSPFFSYVFALSLVT